MVTLTFNTRGTNVGLTKHEENLVAHKLAPIGRLFIGESEAVFDTAIRAIETRYGDTRYFVSVRLTARDEQHYAVATEAYLGKALNHVRDDLRRVISTTSSTYGDWRSPAAGYTLKIS